MLKHTHTCLRLSTFQCVYALMMNFGTIGHLSQEIKYGFSHTSFMCVEESNYKKDEKKTQKRNEK